MARGRKRRCPPYACERRLFPRAGWWSGSPAAEPVYLAFRRKRPLAAYLRKERARGERDRQGNGVGTKLLAQERRCLPQKELCRSR